MKGRARAKNALFAIFCENKESTIKSIQDFVKLIIYMRSEFSKGIRKDFKRENYLKKKEITYPLYNLPTGAKLSIKNTKILFNEIMTEVRKLVSDIDYKLKYTEDSTLVGNEKKIQFICTMYTTSEHLDDDMKEIKSDKFFDKDSSSSHCYLIFLKKLHENEVLDDYFKLNPNN